MDHSRRVPNSAAPAEPDQHKAPTPDWDPLAPDVLENQQAANDNMRAKCPVATVNPWGLQFFVTTTFSPSHATRRHSVTMSPLQQHFRIAANPFR
jgi:hypothetical protein